MNDTDDAGTACASAASMTAPGMITRAPETRLLAASVPLPTRARREDPPARALRWGWRASGSPLRSGAGKGRARGGLEEPARGSGGGYRPAAPYRMRATAPRPASPSAA